MVRRSQIGKEGADAGGAEEVGEQRAEGSSGEKGQDEGAAAEAAAGEEEESHDEL